MPDSGGHSISLIIPVYNEASQLKNSLENLFSGLKDSDVEVILCDGGSSDDSVSIAETFPCKIIHCDPGRARQMNFGSEKASGERLVFLHADSRLPDNWIEQLDLAEDWGFFPVRLSGSHWMFRIIEFSMNLRSRLSHVATGDQGLHFSRRFFRQIGGFPDIPLMEDIAISKYARGLSKPRIGDHALTTSSRRWEQNGIMRTVILMWGLRFAFWLGVSPRRLHRIY